MAEKKEKSEKDLQVDERKHKKKSKKMENAMKPSTMAKQEDSEKFEESLLSNAVIPMSKFTYLKH